MQALNGNQQSGGQQEKEEESDGGGLLFRVEFDNCIEYEGPIPGGDRRDYDLNKYGKPRQLTSKNLNKVKINNTRYDAEFRFKLCIGGGAGANKKDRTLEAAVIATAQFHLAELQTMPNQQANLLIPLSMATTTSMAAKSYHFPQEDLYLLCSLQVSDRTFGELAIHLERLESVPYAPSLCQMKWRVQVLTTLAKQRLNSGEPMKRGKNVEGVIERKEGERIEYDIAMRRHIELDDELNLHLQMKDLFSGTDDEIHNPNLLHLY